MVRNPRQEAAAADEETPLLTPSALPKPVSWTSLPNKPQLAVIVLARLAEPLSERSLSSYLFYQLQSFDRNLSASAIAAQAGKLTAVFAAAQCLTSMWWGRAADNPGLGRKRVLMMGLLGSAIAALGMGFAPSFRVAMVCRFLAGALNGNVGVLRTTISEIVPDKRYQSRAFLLLPMCFNIGVIIGPLMSGYLADPFNSLPWLFGRVEWMRVFPYALPNIVCASILASAALAVMLGLDETHPQLKGRRDPGRALGRLLLQKVFGVHVPSPEELQLASTTVASAQNPVAKKTGLREVFTKNVKLTMMQHFLQALHVSAFNAVLFVLLPSPVDFDHSVRLPFWFSGGLGLSSKRLALVNTTIGVVGIPLQLFIYPLISARLGSLTAYRAFLPFSIVAYVFIPYLVLLPDNVALIWTCLTSVLTLHIMARVFVTPASILLVNQSAPSPAMLGTIHGLASSISSAARILGPTAGGTLLGMGLANNLVGLPFWSMAVTAFLNWMVLWWVEDDDTTA